MNFFIEIQNRTLFPDNIQSISGLDRRISVRDDDLSVAGNSYDQHVWQDLANIRDLDPYETFEAGNGKLDERDFPAGKDPVAQCVLFGQVFIDLYRDPQVRVHDMVDAHDFFYETDLLHVFRIPDTGDRFLTAQTFGKG